MYVKEPKRRGPGKAPKGSSKKRARQGGAGAGGGSRGKAAGRSTAAERAREATGRAAGPSAQTESDTPELAAGADAAPVPGLSGSLAHTPAAFEPQLTGPLPMYPGFAYRPPSPSSSYPPGVGDPISYYTPRPGPSRQSESVHSTTSSAPSVPESEEPESGYTDHDPIDYEELEEFYRQPRPGEREDPPS